MEFSPLKIFPRTKKGSFFHFPTYFGEFPKNFPRIELLDTQSRKFFFIYKMLLNNVSFNPEKKGTTNAKPKGRINWIKTIQKQSRGETLSFVTHQNAKDLYFLDFVVFMFHAL